MQDILDSDNKLSISVDERQVAEILTDLHHLVKRSQLSSLAVVAVVFLAALITTALACGKCARCCRRRRPSNPPPNLGDIELGDLQDPGVSSSTSSTPPPPPPEHDFDQAAANWPPATVADLFSFSAPSNLPPSTVARYSKPWQQQALTTVVNAVGAPPVLSPPTPLPTFAPYPAGSQDGQRPLVESSSGSSEEGFCGFGAKYKKR